MDNHANFAYSTVASAPSPATSGTSLTVQTAAGALFATPPTNLVVWPPSVVPLVTNAEIVRLTAKVGDVFTVTRAQEGSTAQAIAVGYQVADAFTTNLIADLLDEPPALHHATHYEGGTDPIDVTQLTGYPAPLARAEGGGLFLGADRQWRESLPTLGPQQVLGSETGGVAQPILLGDYVTLQDNVLDVAGAGDTSFLVQSKPAARPTRSGAPYLPNAQAISDLPTGYLRGAVGTGIVTSLPTIPASDLGALPGPGQLLGSGVDGPAVQALTLGPNLYMEGTTLKVRTSSTTLLQYDWNSTTVAPPTSSQIRIDAAPPYTAATTLWVRPLTSDGIDASRPLTDVQPETRLLIQDKNDATLYVEVVTTGPTVNAGGYFTIPVTWLANGGALPNNQACLLAVGQRQQAAVVWPAERLVGRGPDAGAGAAEAITLGTGLAFEGTTLVATAKNSGVFGYGFASQTVAPPAIQTVRLNAAAPYTAVTTLWVSFQNNNGEDLYYGWMRTPVGATVLIQDKANHLQFVEVTLTGAVLDKGTYAEVPVAWKANGTALTASKPCLVRTTEPVVALLAALEARVAALEKRMTRRLGGGRGPA